MTAESTLRKRARWLNIGERVCQHCEVMTPHCQTPKDTSDIHIVNICQRCGMPWLDLVESEKARQAMWEREEKELKGKKL